MNFFYQYCQTFILRKYILVLLIGINLLCGISCKKISVIDEHPDFVNTISKIADTIQYKYADKALSSIDSVFSALPAPGTGDVFIKDSIKQNKYAQVKHDYTKSISYLDSMLLLIKDKTADEKYAERYAAVLYEKGQRLLDMKRYNESFHYISMAEDAVKRIKNKCGIVANYSSKIGYLMFAQEKYAESAVYFKKDYNMLLSFCPGDSYREFINMQRCLNNIALAYLKDRAIDSAGFYQNAALHLIQENEYKYPLNKNDILYSKAVIYGDQAEILAIKKFYTEAEKLYIKSIEGTRAKDISYTQVTQARLADLYLTQKKSQPAHIVLGQLKHSLDTFPNEKNLMSWQKLDVKYYISIHQVNSAFIIQQQYEITRDSAEARNKKFATVDTGKEFENLELKYSNEVLQKESKLKNLYLLISIFIFLMATSIAIFVWHNLNQASKLNLKVQQKNEDLQLALSSLEQSHEENTRIIRIVAHDLKSPISAINNLIYSLMKKDYPEDLREIFQLIKTACGNSMDLINDALTQKKDAARIRKELVNMKRLLEYCVDLLRGKAGEKKQQLTLYAENITLLLNRQKIWRVVSNIVNNAIKFSPEHAVIDISLKKKESSVLLSVTDKGIGIPTDLKDKIFSMSPGVIRTGTFGEESYGLGLSISQKIVEEHEGKIWFDSVDGVGSVFYVELPCLNQAKINSFY